MAHWYVLSAGSNSRLSSLNLPVGRSLEVGLWGGGPGGEDLVVSQTDPSVVRLDNFFPRGGIPDAQTRPFQFAALKPGGVQVEARLGADGPVWASVVIHVIATASVADNLYFYHGTTLDEAKKLLSLDLSPMEVTGPAILDWWEYTDFGKGFYTHPHETRQLAVKWAKRKAQKQGADWGVVRFGLSGQEFSNMPGTPLVFPTKASRPANAPIIVPPNPAGWLEFVEFNRGILQRPKDKDWTAIYSWMRGPMWAKADSGLGFSDIGIALPDNIHQINWGQSGLASFNTDAAKGRRFLFTKDNEQVLQQAAVQDSSKAGAWDDE